MMVATVFNLIQFHLLKIFAHMNSGHGLREVQQVLPRYYFKQVEEMPARIICGGVISAPPHPPIL